MKPDSQIAPVLAHLAWLSIQLGKADSPRAVSDLIGLIYNAAVMLQWRYSFPVCELDVIPFPGDRRALSERIEKLVDTARQGTSELRRSGGQDFGLVRQAVWRLVREIGDGFPQARYAPTPARMPELEKPLDIRALLDEYVAAYSDTHTEAITEAWSRGAESGVGIEAAIRESIATLIALTPGDTLANTPPREKAAIKQAAAGFFKTAADLQPETSDEGEEPTESELVPEDTSTLLQRIAAQIHADASGLT